MSTQDAGRESGEVIDLASRRLRSLPPVEELLRQAGLPVPGAKAETSMTSPGGGQPEGEEALTGRVVAHQGEARPPLLPAWASSRAVASAQARAAARRARWHAAYHGIRAPVYAGRVVVLAGRGTRRALRPVGPWLVASDHTAIVRAEEDPRLVVAHKQARSQVRRRRLGVAAGTTAGVGGGLALLALMAPPLILAAVIVTVVGSLAVAGRADGDQVRALLDSPEPPAAVDLAPEHLNAAFRAAGLVKPGDALTLCAPILRDGRGWSVLVDMPLGGGKTAAHAIARRDVLAAELGVDEIQLIMSRVRAHEGGHGRRLSMWVADDDPYMGKSATSALADAESASLWEPVPFGRDARGGRVTLELLWQSMFFGGLPRRGKTFSMRLVVAVAALDAWCRIYLADGKGGADFRAIRGVAHRYIAGADDAELVAFEAMLDELIEEMTRRFALFGTLPTSVCPEGKLTPEIMRKYNLPLIPVVIDELQEYFDALESEKDRQRIISKLARIARRGPAAGFIPVYASQRPDAKSVPTKLREIVTYRYATQVTDKTSSDMVLGDGKAATGADASALSEEHKGVGVLVTGPASYTTVKCDYLDGPAFEAVCARGRKLRQAAGTLTGAAAGDVQAVADEAGYRLPTIVVDVLEAMGSAARMHTDVLLARLVNLDEDTYGEMTAEQLAVDLEAAGVTRSMKQVKIDGANRAGWLRRDIEGVIPAEILADRPAPTTPVDPTPATEPTTDTP